MVFNCRLFSKKLCGIRLFVISCLIVKDKKDKSRRQGMTPEFVISFFLEALKVVILLSGPMLAFGLAAGLIVGIFQAVTQIHEMTLTFIPKMIAVVIALLIFSPWMMEIFINFTTNLFTRIPDYIR